MDVIDAKAHRVVILCCLQTCQYVSQESDFDVIELLTVTVIRMETNASVTLF